MTGAASPTVLVVDDDPEVLTLITGFLRPDYEVIAAESGAAAVDLMDESVDIVLLDRKMPGMSGDAFLDRIRGDGFECPVALVTAVYPDFDISSLAVDDYVLKPVGREALRSTVDSLLDREEMHGHTRDYLATRAKLDVLESVKEPFELRSSDEYSRLQQQVRSLEPLAIPQLDRAEGVP